MALDSAAFNDLRNFIKRRVGFVKYRIENSYYQTMITDATVLPTGIVRVQASIVPAKQKATIDRVELHNINGELWAHQDVSITIDQGQTGVLYWFDFTIKEGT